jgi:hypothetical protein
MISLLILHVFLDHLLFLLQSLYSIQPRKFNLARQNFLSSSKKETSCSLISISSPIFNHDLLFIHMMISFVAFALDLKPNG